MYLYHKKQYTICTHSEYDWTNKSHDYKNNFTVIQTDN